MGRARAALRIAGLASELPAIRRVVIRLLDLLDLQRRVLPTDFIV